MAATQAQSRWPGDQLKRSYVGDYLTKFATARFEAQHRKPHAGAMCFAIDADWGAGKSFFVKHWSDDLSALGHPVIRFDAWVNDLSDDPLLGFLAKFQADLKPWIKKMSTTAAVKATASRKLKVVLKQAGRAVLPAAAVVGKAVARKYFGEGLEELRDVIGSATGEGEEPESVDLSSASAEALETFLARAMETHTARQVAIAELKESIAALLTYLEEHQLARLPLYVVVDELDRCRPDYAIRLLEGIKHLFDAPGVCFVFSTNLKQLSESTRAIYGSGFDAYRYLQRFFSFQFVLPTASLDDYARLLVTECGLGSRPLRVHSGMPNGRASGAPTESALATTLARVAKGFNLDLRSMRQVLLYAEAVIAQLPEDKCVHAYYLLFLCALFHRSVDAFDKVVAASANSAVSEQCSQLGVAGTIAFETFDGRQMRPGSLALVALFIQYQTLAGLDLDQLSERSFNASVYPDSALVAVAQDYRNRLYEPHGRPTIASYADLVRSSGHLRLAEE